MIENELIDIVIAPNDKLSEELTQKVAAIINQDIYRTRILLASKIPRIIAQTTEEYRAKDIISKIESLGFVSYNYKHADLYRTISLFKANTLEFTDNNIIFKDKSAQIFSLEEQNVFLILKGILRTSKQSEIITSVKKLNFTATLLTGGIPISRTVKERSSESTTQIEGFIRIFGRNSADPCLEIRQYSFNYSCLGPEMFPSSTQNLNLIARKIAGRFPEAVFEDKSNKSLSPNSAPNYSVENIDIEGKLVYLYYQSINSKKPG